MALRILVVEDEMTIALYVEDLLAELGHEVAGLAMRLPQAMEMAKSAEIDMAILDVNLDGRTSYPVADILAARGVPFFFATGYGLGGVEAPYNQRRIIQKPFNVADLQRAIAAERGEQ